MTFRVFSILTLLTVLFACTDNPRQDNMEENASKLDDAGLPPVALENDVQLSPMPSTFEFPDAAIQEWTYQDGKFKYVVSDYEFAAQTPDATSLMCANSGKGQHAHLIINNDPYLAKYEPEFEVELTDGEHHILTFLSRSYHESIKNGKAFRAVKATVKDQSFVSAEDIKEPMLFYSRPKGRYVGKAANENIMLDFYPVNVELSEDGYYVQAIVNDGPPMKITKWQPYFLTGLPMGDNTVQLSLMKDGELVNAPLNPVIREFVVEPSPADMGQ